MPDLTILEKVDIDEDGHTIEVTMGIKKTARDDVPTDVVEQDGTVVGTGRLKVALAMEMVSELLRYASDEHLVLEKKDDPSQNNSAAEMCDLRDRVKELLADLAGY